MIHERCEIQLKISLFMHSGVFMSQVVIAYISYLCTRLLDLREECRAARVIQAAWREYRVTRRTQHLQVLVARAHKLHLD